MITTVTMSIPKHPDGDQEIPIFHSKKPELLRERPIRGVGPEMSRMGLGHF